MTMKLQKFIEVFEEAAIKDPDHQGILKLFASTVSWIAVRDGINLESEHRGKAAATFIDDIVSKFGKCSGLSQRRLKIIEPVIDNFKVEYKIP